MISNAGLIETTSKDPYLNLAVERYLLTTSAPDTIIMYLWQNENTVVIGLNQNAYSECNLDVMKADNVRLARRTTGGGAVFHDLGNLNFSFIMPRSMKSEGIPVELIMNSCRRFGIDATITGRNDICVEGRKFSGNAFCQTKDMFLHHGTILIDADTDRMKKYLNVSKEKLASKGVKSVSSRVINLKELRPDISIEAFGTSLRDAFEEKYKGLTYRLDYDRIAKEAQVETLRSLYTTEDWRLNKVPDREEAESIITEWT